MLENSILLHLTMMGDPVWFVLFKADITNPACIKGTVMVKELIADI
jgi:hypothetical protein